MSELALQLPRPVEYAERKPAKHDALDRAVVRGQSMLVPMLARRTLRRVKQIQAAAADLAGQVATMSDAALAAEARALGRTLRVSQCRDPDALAMAFALICEASGRTLGMRHYPVQMIGALVMLDGKLAEMQTGEGKTLTATLAATTAALTGWPVHVVTVNDYLAERDAETMQPLYAFFGLSVGVVTSGMAFADRQQQYAADITYCTNKELAFDYLKDRIVVGQKGANIHRKMGNLTGQGGGNHLLLLRGLHFAIVDEADSVLIDEARTPLIISGQSNDAADIRTFVQAMSLLDELDAERHYVLRLDERAVKLTDTGRDLVTERMVPLGGPWVGRILREELVEKALSARFLYQRDEHYLVADGKVQIIDEYTGRLMPDRFWGEGLHQMIELKEGCEPTGRRITLARMTYQRFFSRYRRLGGMTGTGAEATGELWRVYGLAVTPVPTHRPVQRIMRPDLVVDTEERKWDCIVEAVSLAHSQGLPVLLGTRSVAASEKAQQRLSGAGLACHLLNAAQDAEEAEIVARAGSRGRITIATNMAGRGTDILIADDIAAAGGLQVIMSERHDASRIDRQLAGRTGRQGAPGTFQAILSLEDPLMDHDRLGLLKRFATMATPVTGGKAGRMVMRLVQYRAERQHARIRANLLRMDEKMEQALAFSGASE